MTSFVVPQLFALVEIVHRSPTAPPPALQYVLAAQAPLAAAAAAYIVLVGIAHCSPAAPPLAPHHMLAA